jgi:lipoprotein-anchoring transpeptidase ErfK/SrfK
MVLVGLGMPSTLDVGLSDEEWSFIQPQPADQHTLGRVTVTTTVREEVGLNKPVVEWLAPENIIPLFEVIEGPGNNPRNTTWYRVENGYVYSSTVQPIRPYRLPQIMTDAGEWGFWAEVVVPYTFARLVPNGPPADGMSTYYYSTVYHVVDVDQDADGNVWYKIFDEAPKVLPETGWTVHPWVIARHLRPVDIAEFEPITVTANAARKSIQVNLDQQMVYCYEDDQLIFSTLCSTGGEGFDTPRGEHHVVLKQPSRHMYSDTNLADPNFYDLPGVPWTTFFTTLGHAIHGTYWHNDYGRVRSAGCVNVSPEAAKWIYCWNTPVAPYESDFVPGNRTTGTPVIVV